MVFDGKLLIGMCLMKMCLCDNTGLAVTSTFKLLMSKSNLCPQLHLSVNLVRFP